MAKPKRIYLAGPDVFLPAGEHQAIVAEKKRLLREYGFEGVDPLDTELAFSDDEAKPERGHGGITTRVVEAGDIALGDEVQACL